MGSQFVSQDDVAAAVHAIHRIAAHVRVSAKPDARTIRFLIGVAEITLRVRAQGKLGTQDAAIGAIEAAQAVMGCNCAQRGLNIGDGYLEGRICGAAIAGTLRAGFDSPLLRSARAVSSSHGMGLAEAIAVLAIGGKH